MKALTLVLVHALTACASPTNPTNPTTPDGGAIPTDGGAIVTPDAITSCTTTIADPSGVRDVAACVLVPSFTAPTNGYPVIFAYHAVGDTWAQALSRIQMNRLADGTWGAGKAIVVAPEGLKDAHNARYFDAGDTCCDDYDADADDVAFADVLLTQLEALYPVDPARVGVMGISNGGVMANAIECTNSRFGLGALDASGVFYNSTSTISCATAARVRKAHGRSDTTLYFDDTNPSCPGGAPCRFEGQSTLDVYASANDATVYGCSGYSATGVHKDYNASVSGAESTEYTATGCPTGTSVDFFDMASTLHIPAFTAAWQNDNIAWFGL